MTNLNPCPKSDCKAPITHWHNVFGNPEACTFAMRGEHCPNDYTDTPCYAPRVQPEPQPERPLHLPDVDTVARAIYESDYVTNWDADADSVKDSYRDGARAVLDLLVAHQPVWERAERGTRIEKGQRYRIEYANGDAYELTAFGTRSVQDDGITVYVLRTAPAPETRESIIREFAAELDSIYTKRTAGDGTWIGVLGTLVNRLDALGGESA